MLGWGGGEHNSEKQHLLQETEGRKALDWKLGQLLILSAGRKVGREGLNIRGNPSQKTASLSLDKISAMIGS